MSPAVSWKQLWPVLESTDSSDGYRASFVSTASTALVLYEYAITVGLEVQQIWKHGVSTAMTLFMLTRYITLLDHLFLIISVFSSKSLEACSVVTWLHAITTSVLIAVMSAIAAVRVFALWNRNWRLFVVIMIPGLFPAFANLYFRSRSTVLLLPLNLHACVTVPTAMSALMYKNLSIASRAVSIFADGLVVVLTWLKTYRVFVLTRGISFGANYSTLILRDGTLYFLAVCAMNAVAIVYVAHTGSNLLNDIIITLSSILMSRFLLNLRRHRTRTERESQSIALTSSMGMPSRSLSALKFTPSRSDSMGRSMIGDCTGDDAAAPGRDLELVEARRSSDSGRYDAFLSVSTAATSIGSVSSKELPLVPGDKDTAESAARDY